MANRMTESDVMVESYIRGYHVYKDAAGWDPQLNEERALKREPKNIKDVNAVAVVRPNLEDGSLETTAKEHANTVSGFDEILGHIPLRMAEFVTKFLKRGTNKGKAIITGKPVKRGAGYGMEIPCKYVFYGDVETSLPWLKSKLDYLGYSVWYNQ